MEGESDEVGLCINIHITVMIPPPQGYCTGRTAELSARNRRVLISIERCTLHLLNGDIFR